MESAPGHRSKHPWKPCSFHPINAQGKTVSIKASWQLSVLQPKGEHPSLSLRTIFSEQRSETNVFECTECRKHILYSNGKVSVTGRLFTRQLLPSAMSSAGHWLCTRFVADKLIIDFRIGHVNLQVLLTTDHSSYILEVDSTNGGTM